MIRCAKKTIPRGKYKHYRVFWSRHLEEAKEGSLRNTADQTGRTEDVKAWRRQSDVLRVQAWRRQSAVLRQTTS
ncbi:unnamed protein product [Rodentolepis nana]|uniref:Integrase n=1 Tax=Rodentolepis nana TaxID=102285 RepID=A0A0R3U0Z0_RODNA|nr:unnamed protein product [Rodentolepis nana]